MTGTRWRKVLADLCGNKTRTILTILTISVGVFTIGFATGMRGILLPDTDATYAAANPHSAILYTTPFEEQVLQYVQDVPGVTEVDARASVIVRLIASEERKIDLNIDSISPSEMLISLPQPVEPSELPPLDDGAIWIECGARDLFPVQVGETLGVQLSSGQVPELRVTAVVRDASMPSAAFSSALSAFANPATVESLGGVASHDKLLLVVDEHTRDKDRGNAVVKAVSARLREHDVMVMGTWTYNPGEHFSRQIAVGIMIVLDMLVGMAVLLSTFLVINTINSLLSQHVRHIGIMKAIGGRVGQIVAMYFVFILTCGLLALLIAVPAGALAAYGACAGMARFIHIGLRGFRLVPQAVVGQALTALLVPLVAAAGPVLVGTRVPVREALSDYGVGRFASSRGWAGRLLERIHLPRPTLLALRNAFRRKGQLALTLSTLVLGGAIFIAVLNLGKSSEVMISEIQGYFLASVLIYFLLVMAVLIAIVGGLGLTGTMSLNVMERTREIGVLRAVGASDGNVLRMVIAEGAIMGLTSWVLALGLSFPLILVLGASVGQVLFQQVMTFTVGWQGLSYWLIGVLVLAAGASALPAWRAVRLTVRDVLAYQ